MQAPPSLQKAVHRAQLHGKRPKNMRRTLRRIARICGYVARGNRRSQAQFSCTPCGYTTHADGNAALRMRRRALVIVPEVAGRCSQQLALVPATSPSMHAGVYDSYPGSMGTRLPQSSIYGKAFGNLSAAVRPSQDNWAYAAQ